MDKGFGESKEFKINDEWYALKNLPDDLHVIIVQDTKGMTGPDVPPPQLPHDLGPAARQGPRLLHLDGPPRGRLGEPQVPGPPARRPGLGHGPVDASIEPNVKEVTPQYNQLPA